MNLLWLHVLAATRAAPDPNGKLVSYLGIGFLNPPDIVNRTCFALKNNYVTHLNLAFFGLDKNGDVKLPYAGNSGARGGSGGQNLPHDGEDLSTTPPSFKEHAFLPGLGTVNMTLANLTAHLKSEKCNPNAHLLVSIGGWNIANSADWGPLIRTNLVDNLSNTKTNIDNFIAKYNLSGVDLDWEYPGRAPLYSLSGLSSNNCNANSTYPGKNGTCAFNYILDNSTKCGTNEDGWQSLAQMNNGIQPCIGGHKSLTSGLTGNEVTGHGDEIFNHGRPIPGGGTVDKDVGAYKAANGFGSIMQTLCNKLPICSMTIDGATWANHWYMPQLKTAIDACTYVSIMAYDYAGFWQGSSTTSFNSPLFQDTEFCPPKYYNDSYSIGETMVWAFTEKNGINHQPVSGTNWNATHLGTGRSMAWLKDQTKSHVYANYSDQTSGKNLPFCPQVIFYDMLVDPGGALDCTTDNTSHVTTCKTCFSSTKITPHGKICWQPPCKACYHDQSKLNSNDKNPKPLNHWPPGMSDSLSYGGYFGYINANHIPLTIEHMWHNMLLNINNDKSKYVLGLALYGRKFEYNADNAIGSAASTGLYEAYTTGGALTYSEIMKIYRKKNSNYKFTSRPMTSAFNYGTLAEAYAFNDQSKTFITYDNETTVAYKSQWAKDMGMAGVMTFHLGGDYYSGYNEPGALLKASTDSIWNSVKPAVTPAPTPRPTLTTPAPTPSSGKKWYEEWWFWLVIGIVILGLGVALWYNTRPDTTEEMTDNENKSRPSTKPYESVPKDSIPKVQKVELRMV